MRILMFGPNPETKGGIATVIANFKQHFNSSTNTIFYAESWKEGNILKRTYYSVHGLVTLPHQINKQNIDAVHIHMAQDGSYFRKAMATRLAKRSGKKVLLHIHGSHFDQYHEESKPWLQRHILRTLRKADKIIVLNEDVKTYFATFGIPMDIVNNAVPVPTQPLETSKRTQISAFGQLGTRKGTYDILEVAEQLQISHPEAQIYLYGDGDTKQAQAIITRKQLQNVHLGGWITAEQKAEAMQKTMIHLLPSYQEGLPMAVLETMACGIPNISTYVGGIPNVIASGKDGLLIEAGKQDQLLHALITLIEQENKRNQMGKAAATKIKTEFSMPAYIEKWNQIYAEWDT
ncbi:glycosyltransferase family 4 protein [Listeria booriae]|uniref:Glycosyltransferase family 4 protein n=1 Tax=Listeria booriae TaxID=1552123 RepID=A0A7X0YKR0_9LIST|nr:glycosyltransferase family 4 protein [Listeria booriae]MBC2116265.1 glycosyltransferase family 4 protein [Listeria booriae]MBC2195369.1 glycosyltransferase family 4 protein [Listeria booriae]